MNKITVYERHNFDGENKEFTSDVANLCDCNFNDRIYSVKVTGNPWVAYKEVNFKVPLAIYEEGDYAEVKNLGTISSLQLVTEDLTNPQITLYELVNYLGKSLVITNETSLSSCFFNDRVSSHKVQRGAWALYENPDQTGKIMVARAGQDVPNYGLFTNCLSYLHPLKPGKSKLKGLFNWSKKQEKINSVTTYSLCCLNSNEKEKPFCPNLKQAFEVIISESFIFTGTAGIVVGCKFGLDLGGLKKAYAIPVNDTFTVEKGITKDQNTRTEKKAIEVPLPATVPPLTKLTVNVVTKEMTVKIPVHLIFEHVEVECGEYTCNFEITTITENKKERA